MYSICKRSTYMKRGCAYKQAVTVLIFYYKDFCLIIKRIPLCSLINQHLQVLSAKFPATKFIKSISTTCIPNYPDKNLPTVFVYFENQMKNQTVGPLAFNGMNLKCDDLEWMLHRIGALSSTLNRDKNSDFEKNDRLESYEKKMINSIRQGVINKADDSDNEY